VAPAGMESKRTELRKRCGRHQPVARQLVYRRERVRGTSNALSINISPQRNSVARQVRSTARFRTLVEWRTTDFASDATDQFPREDIAI
jgi:hypothetical protein